MNSCSIIRAVSGRLLMLFLKFSRLGSSFTFDVESPRLSLTIACSRHGPISRQTSSMRSPIIYLSVMYLRVDWSLGNGSKHGYRIELSLDS